MRESSIEYAFREWAGEQRVLVVEDDAHDQYLVREVIEQKSGYVAEIVDQAEVALVLLESGRHFTLIITDVKLPGMDGISLAKRLNQTHPHVPVIILTGYDAEWTIKQTEQLGFLMPVFKPLDEIKFRQALMKLGKPLFSQHGHTARTPAQ